MIGDKGKRLYRRRLTIVVAIIGCLLILLAARLVQLQIGEHHRYAIAARANRIRIEPVAPARGLIYDRGGRLLAENVPGYTLEVVPDEAHHLQKTLKALQKLLPIHARQIKRFNALVKATPSFDPVPLLTNLDAREVARIAVNSYRFPGVELHTRLQRHYPHGDLTADSTGYVGRISAAELHHVNAAAYADTIYFGKRGIELKYQNILHGQPGYRIVEVDAAGRPVKILRFHKATPGDDLILTLDLGMQKVAAKALEGQRGAVVVLNAHTGSILALVSSPSFNANWFINGISTARFQTLLKNPGKPLWNRAVASGYATGSCIKPFIALAGLNDGVITNSQTIYSGPYYVIPDDPTKHKFWDWQPWGHGWTDLRKAIAQSVDTYFYPLAYKLGIHRMDNMLRKFGFGQCTHIDLPNATCGLLPSPEWKRKTLGEPWYPGDTVVMGIGQGYLQVSMVQLAEATARLATRGHSAAPHLLRAILPPGHSKAIPIRIHKLPTIRVRSPQYWNDVIAGMRAVVTSPEGTAHRTFKGFPYPVAGKTGTAQVVNVAGDPFKEKGKIPYRMKSNALFEAFTPVRNPQIVAVAIVEHAGMTLGPASTIVRKLFSYWYKHHQAFAQTVPNRSQLQLSNQ